MLEAFLDYLWAFVAGIAGGGVVSIGLRWAISRRCYKLEVGLLDLQRVLLSVKGQAGAEKRWKTRDLLDEQMMQMKPGQTAQERYANDPPNFG